MQPVWELRPERNLLHAANQARVPSLLRQPNIIFGWHYFLHGGRGGELVAYSDAESCIARVQSARPGDMFAFYSLEGILPQALLVLGEPCLRDPLGDVGGRIEQVVNAVREHDEVLAIWRSVPASGAAVCDAEVLWDLAEEDWLQLKAKWRTRDGQLSFWSTRVLDEIDDAAKARHTPEQHPESPVAIYGKRPDERGFTPRGGAYRRRACRDAPGYPANPLTGGEKGMGVAGERNRIGLGIGL